MTSEKTSVFSAPKIRKRGNANIANFIVFLFHKLLVVDIMSLLFHHHRNDAPISVTESQKSHNRVILLVFGWFWCWSKV